MSAHTPGPWIEAKGAFPPVVVSEQESIAVISTGTFMGALPMEKITANARLIAAAPDLLEALERFVALDDGDEPALWNFAAEIEQMRAAIKKARGE